MKIWIISDPVDFQFARANIQGTWSPMKNEFKICPECTQPLHKRIKPLVIEWESGSDVIGDFLWPEFASIAVSERSFKALESQFQGFERGPVEMIQDPKLIRPKRITKRTTPRIWLPYESIPLHELWVTSWVHIDMHKSSVEYEKKCGTCTQEFYKITGIEHSELSWNSYLGVMYKTRTPREPGQGVFIDNASLKGADIFRVHEFPAWTLCTDRVREFIEKENLTNVTCFEMGEAT